MPSNAEPSAFAYNVLNGHPYHRLGVQVDGYMTIQQGLELIGCKDEVIEPRTLHVLDNGVPGGALEEVEGWVSIHSSKFGTMGVRKPSYEIMDRPEILQLAFDLIGLDPDIHHLDTIGNIGNKGEVFFAYVKMPELVIDPRGVCDTIERGFVVSTSFDGSLKTTINESDIRIECLNSLILGTKFLTNGITATHVGGAEERLRRAALARDFAGAKEAEVVKRAERMLRRDGDWALSKLLDHFYPLGPALVNSVRTRRIQARTDIRNLYDGENNKCVAKLGHNGWAAYQAFVEYLDFRRPVRVRGGDAGKARAMAATFPGSIVNQKFAAHELVLAA